MSFVSTKVSSELFELLKKIDTPTVCNSIEIVQGKRGFADFTRETVQIAFPKLPPLIGYAKTATIKATEPSSLPVEEVKEMRMNYYEYMSQANSKEDGVPNVCVIADLDYPQAIGAYWGEINTWIHKSFGLTGVLTNGVMRDLDVIPTDFQVIAGSIGPSHGFVHVLNYAEPVEVFGMKVESEDLIHADRHGAVVIPSELIGDLTEGIHKLIAAEKIILDAAKAGPLTMEAFKKAWKGYDNARV